MYRERQIWQPQDILTIHPQALKSARLPDWFARAETPFLAVVRRDYSPKRFVPIGLRGLTRNQRYGLFIDPKFILSRLSPEDLTERISQFPIRGPQIDFLTKLLDYKFPFRWGITGSIAYSLASGTKYWKESSDIDLRICLPQEVPADFFDDWLSALQASPARIDTQLESPCGGFALEEWLNSRSVLLKTNRGPLITEHPWSLN